MSSWIWLSSVPGSPGGDGWIGLNSYQHGYHSELYQHGSNSVLTFNAPRSGGAYNRLVEICAKGDVLEEAILFVGPQTEMHFYPVSITMIHCGVQQMSCTFVYDKYFRKYDGTP